MDTQFPDLTRALDYVNPGDELEYVGPNTCPWFTTDSRYVVFRDGEDRKYILDDDGDMDHSSYCGPWNVIEKEEASQQPEAVEGYEFQDLIGVTRGTIVRCVKSYSDFFNEGESYPVRFNKRGQLGVYDGVHVPMLTTSTRFVIDNTSKLTITPEQITSSTQMVRSRTDGGSTDYYTLPSHADELRHLISHKDMSKSRGDIFKACYRLGEKEGQDVITDLRKIAFFAQDLLEMHERGERV